MALIFSPLDEGILEGPYRPLPRGAFIMQQLGAGRSQLEAEMGTAVLQVLKQLRFIPYDAASERSQKDFLVKIIQLIRGCGFGIAILSEPNGSPTRAMKHKSSRPK